MNLHICGCFSSCRDILALDPATTCVGYGQSRTLQEVEGVGETHPLDIWHYATLNIYATEGSLATVSCTTQGPAACARSTCCHTLPMWEQLDKLVDDFFEGITIADLLRDTK